jgi:WD40 repeat protein
MKELKPKFMLTRVYGDGTEDRPEIVPLSQAVAARMNRRGFFAAGLTGTAALVLLTRCGNDESKPGNECNGIYAHDKEIYSLAVSPDGKWLFSGSGDNTIKIWSLPEGALIKTLKGHSDSVRSLAVSSDGKQLFSGSWDGAIKIWSLPEGSLIKTLKGHSDSVRSLAVSPDGKRLFSASDDRTVKIWSLPEGTLIKTLERHNSWVTSLAVSPDGKQLFSASYDKTIKIWSLPGGTEEKTLTDSGFGNIRSLAVTPSGNRLLSGDSNGVIGLITLPDEIVARKMNAGLSVAALSVSPDGEWLAAGGDGRIQLWSLSGLVLKEEAVSGNTIYSLIFSADNRLLFSGDSERKLQIRILPYLAFDKCLLDLECVEDTIEGTTYNIKDESGRTVTYTLPCGSPVPAGAKCTCDCVPGKICSCDSQCSCVGNKCSCVSQGGCSCNKVCTCVPVRY